MKTQSEQRHFHSWQPKSNKRRHRYPTRSSSRATNEAEMIEEKIDFVYLRDDEEKTTNLWKQYEFILQDKYGEPRSDKEGEPAIVIGMPQEDLVSRVFLTKSDKRGHIKDHQVQQRS